MESTIGPGLQLILLFCLAVMVGIAFGTLTMMIQLRRWNTAILSLAVAVWFLLIGWTGILSRMNPIFHTSMIIGALLAFLIFVPIVAIGSYVGLRMFLQNRYSELFADNDEESTEVIITQSPTPAQSRALPVAFPRTSQSRQEKGSHQENDSDKQKPGRQKNRLLFRRSRRL